VIQLQFFNHTFHWNCLQCGKQEKVHLRVDSNSLKFWSLSSCYHLWKASSMFILSCIYTGEIEKFQQKTEQLGILHKVERYPFADLFCKWLCELCYIIDDRHRGKATFSTNFWAKRRDPWWMGSREVSVVGPTQSNALIILILKCPSFQAMWQCMKTYFGVPVVFCWSIVWGWHLWQLCQCWVVQGDGVTLTVEDWNPAHTISGWCSFSLRHVMCVSIKAIYILTHGLTEDRLSDI